MTPSERLTQRLGMNDGKTASRPPQERLPERTAATAFRERLGVKEPPKVEPAKVQEQAANRDAAIKRASDPRQVNKGSPEITALTMGRAPDKTQQQAQGRPADRLTGRLATPTPSQPTQGRPAPSAQRQQAPSGPAARLDARLASGGTEKIAAAMAQQKQRGPTPGRGM